MLILLDVPVKSKVFILLQFEKAAFFISAIGAFTVVNLDAYANE